MNTLTLADKSPLCSFRLASMGQTRIPSDGYTDCSAVNELDDEAVVGENDALGPGLADFTRL